MGKIKGHSEVTMTQLSKKKKILSQFATPS